MSVWIFQALQKEYDLKRELREGRDDWWRVTRLWKEMRKGDRVIFWQAGKQSGIYGVGELTTNPYPAESKFRVDVKCKREFHPPILKNKLLKHRVLKGLSILQQPYRGTNFRATVEQWNAVEQPEEIAVQVSGGGFADPKTRKKVEAAAIAFVTHELNRRGFQVHDHQRDNQGYDLLADSPSSRLLVEVKGTDSLEPRFFLTRNERRCGSEKDEWRLFVVCKARSAPLLHEYTADEMHRRFTLDPLAWECMRND